MHKIFMYKYRHQRRMWNNVGIVGFIGEQPAPPILLEGLSKLEYRGV